MTVNPNPDKIDYSSEKDEYEEDFIDDRVVEDVGYGIEYYDDEDEEDDYDDDYIEYIG